MQARHRRSPARSVGWAVALALAAFSSAPEPAGAITGKECFGLCGPKARPRDCRPQPVVGCCQAPAETGGACTGSYCTQ